MVLCTSEQKNGVACDPCYRSGKEAEFFFWAMFFCNTLILCKKYTEYMAIDVRLTSFPRQYQAGREKNFQEKIRNTKTV